MKSRLLHMIYRGLRAERSLKQLEKRVVFEGVKLENGKTHKTKEEPKDFSRIIATNIQADVNLRRTILDNGTRVFIAISSIAVAWFYKKILDKREIKLDEAEEALEKSQNDLKKERQTLQSEQAQVQVEQKKAKETLGSLQRNENMLKTNAYEFYLWGNTEASKVKIADATVKKLCGENKECYESYEKAKISAARDAEKESKANFDGEQDQNMETMPNAENQDSINLGR